MPQRCWRQLERLPPTSHHHPSQLLGSIMVKRSFRRKRISTSRTRLAEGVRRGLKGLRFPSMRLRASSYRMMEGQLTSPRRYHRSTLIEDRKSIILVMIILANPMPNIPSFRPMVPVCWRQLKTESWDLQTRPLLLARCWSHLKRGLASLESDWRFPNCILQRMGTTVGPSPKILLDPQGIQRTLGTTA
jgi:hypothetical protein